MKTEAFFTLTYGLYVISAAAGGKKNGYVGNTVFQVTATPPQMAVSCNKDNFTASLIAESGYFSVAVLERDTPAELIGLFGFSSGREVDKYATVKHLVTDHGTPVLLENTIAWFECRVVKTLDVGTHVVFTGEIIANDLLMPGKEPLTYAYYHQVKKGSAPKNAPTHIPEEKTKKKETVAAAGGIYRCAVCGYEYDPAVGDPEAGIPPGTLFEDLPDDWHCPVCGSSKKEFYAV